MRIKVLASGSTGNATYLEIGEHKILIDVGICKKSIEYGLNTLNLSFSDIDTLLITHEHIDHIKALAACLRKSALTCYMTNGTYQAIVEGKNEVLSSILEEKLLSGHLILFNKLANSILYEDVFLGDVLLQILPTFHDAKESVGFKISFREQSIVYLTDTGYVHQNLFPIINNADCYVLECNHDPYILMNSERTYSLKMRILSDHGHLSNEDAFVTLANVIGERTKLVFCAHISQECNLTEIIELTRKKVMDEIGVDVSKIEFVITSPVATKVYEL